MKISSVLAVFFFTSFSAFQIACQSTQGATPVTAATLDHSSLSDKTQAIDKLLNGFHKAASEAKFDAYFNSFASDAVFLGTDASERWTVPEFKAYVAPHFAKGKGWTYSPRDRHISFPSTAEGLAYFDEILDSKSYGTARGSGVIVKEANQWKIAQYNLSFPLPNDLAKKMTDEIKAFESKSKLK